MKNSLYILSAGCLWGIISFFISVLKGVGFNSLECVAIRAVFAAVVLLIYILVTDTKKLSINIRDLKWFVGTGIGSIVFFNYCYFQAIELIGGSTIPALLLYTAPIFVVVMSAIFFREKITATKVIALFITLLGLGFVTGAFAGGEKLTAVAFLFGIGSGFGYALYSIFGKKVVEKYDSLTISFYTFLIAAIGVVPVSGVIRNVKLLLNVKGLSAAIGLAILSTVLPFLLYTKGLSKIEAGKASILATIEPMVAAVVGVIAFHESFSIQKTIGMILIILAIVILNQNSENGQNGVKNSQ